MICMLHQVTEGVTDDASLLLLGESNIVISLHL